MHVTLWTYDIDIDERVIAAPAEAIRRQVREYEHGNRRDFDLEVRVPDTFTGAVMRAILDIPYGETRTYGEIATAVDASPLAVGQACGDNPVPVVVPCHRVVGADSLGGFSVGGNRSLELKRTLLARERADTNSIQSPLKAYSQQRDAGYPNGV